MSDLEDNQMQIYTSLCYEQKADELPPLTPTATHFGNLTFGVAQVPCVVAQLDDRVYRIITNTGLFNAFGRARRTQKRQLPDVPSMLQAKNLLPFITDEIRSLTKLVVYQSHTGKFGAGFDAQLIPAICQVYLEAERFGALLKSQIPFVEQARLITYALAKTGIAALIDEATGYQEEREKDELQRLLSAYIASDYAKWTSTFPRDFFRDIFRLHGWQYEPTKLTSPQCVGNFINQYIYKEMSPEVLEELRRINPVGNNGYRKRKHHQHLTQEIGRPHLQYQITKVLTVMKLSESKEEFVKNYARLKAAE